MIASTIQSASPTSSRPPLSRLPVSISRAALLVTSGDGRCFVIRCTAVSAKSPRSTKATGTPAFAIVAAIPDPMVPAPITAALVICFIPQPPEWSRFPDPNECPAQRWSLDTGQSGRADLLQHLPSDHESLHLL